MIRLAAVALPLLAGCGSSGPDGVTAEDVDNRAEDYMIAADADLEQRIADLEDENEELRRRVDDVESETSTSELTDLDQDARLAEAESRLQM